MSKYLSSSVTPYTTPLFLVNKNKKYLSRGVTLASETTIESKKTYSYRMSIRKHIGSIYLTTLNVGHISQIKVVGKTKNIDSNTLYTIGVSSKHKGEITKILFGPKKLCELNDTHFNLNLPQTKYLVCQITSDNNKDVGDIFTDITRISVRTVPKNNYNIKDRNTQLLHKQQLRLPQLVNHQR